MKHARLASLCNRNLVSHQWETNNASNPGNFQTRQRGQPWLDERVNKGPLPDESDRCRGGGERRLQLNTGPRPGAGSHSISLRCHFLNSCADFLCLKSRPGYDLNFKVALNAFHYKHTHTRAQTPHQMIAKDKVGRKPRK